MEMVNNKDFALILARVYLIEKYGVENVKRQEPLKIEDLKEKWKINGTLISGHLGGVAEIEIRKQDGAILKIRHGK
jgi:riboflavin synthase alpha subunit